MVKKCFDPKSLVKKMSGKKIFGSTKILEPKIFWVKKKNVLIRKFWSKKVSGKNIFGSTKILEPKTFWVENFVKNFGAKTNNG